MDFEHIPVLLSEVLEVFNLEKGDLFVDCTLGGAGHSFEILKRIIPGGHLIGIDQDQNALEAARKKLENYLDNVSLICSNFENLAQILHRYAPGGIDGILFDLGVSSHQLDAAQRGFSYMQDAPLDMRMNRSKTLNAQIVINTYSPGELERIIWEYGEERWAKRIVQFIIEARKDTFIETTGQLVSIIKKAIPQAARRDGPHPAKRTFQAIRIEVNRELEVLEKAIDIAVDYLRPGGKIGIISFHSLEDRIVKERFKFLAADCICPKELPICQCSKKSMVKILTRKPIIASKKELELNPRARSAKLRAALRLS